MVLLKSSVYIVELVTLYREQISWWENTLPNYYHHINYFDLQFSKFMDIVYGAVQILKVYNARNILNRTC